MGSRETERIGPYRIQARLGAGGMGEVLLAYDDRLGRSVAIKRLRPDGGPGADERRLRLRREARAAAGLSHPAIVQVHDLVVEPDSDAVVMEFVPGRTLARELAEGRIGGARALSLARQVTEGLAAAHARGFVHRDLKTENVMVTPDGNAKILDFGLARELAADAGDDSLTAAGTVLGTTRAMSPEQAAGREVDARSDLFSLGVLLYELFTGRSPFRAESPLASLHRVLTERPPSVARVRPEVPAELSRLIDSLLEKDPAARPADAAEVAAHLAALAGAPGMERLGPPPKAAAGTGPGAAVAVPAGAGAVSGGSLAPLAAVLAGLRRPGLRGAWIAAAAVAVVAAAWVLSGPWRRAEPLRVVVMAVPGPPAAADPEAVAFAIEEAVLGGLAELEGIEALDPSQAAGAAAVPAAARAAAADELVRAALDCRSGECRVSLHRLAAGGGVLGVSEPFFVPTAPEDAYDLAAAVAGHLAPLFADHRPRRPLARPPVQSRDYAAVLELKRRNDRGEEALGAAELEELERLLATSPGLLEGQLLAAGVARTLGRLDQALGFAEAAHRTAPGDPRPLAERFRVELAGGDLAAAEESLERLGELAPGQSRTLAMRTELLAAHGRLDEAVALARRVVRRRSSWRNLYLLADLELASGKLEPARARLEGALREMPDNPWLLAKLAELETRDGELAAAADLYRRLTAVRPRRQYLTNLGWIGYLRGDFEDAAASYRRALELDPSSPLARFNLAAALEASGRGGEAREIYRELLAEGEPGGELPDVLRAQCLARLGERRAAHRLIGEVLARQPDRPDVLYQASQVYSLLGERLAALETIERARQRGVRPHWFAVPEFAALRSDPAFGELTADSG